MNRFPIILGLMLFLVPGQVTAVPSSVQTERHQPVEITLESSRNYSHPHKSVAVHGRFTGPDGHVVTIRGFWDGDRTWRLRFAPPDEGTWQYRTVCSDTTNHGLHDRWGHIDVGPYTGDDPFAEKGWLKVSGNQRYLTYGDGDPFFWLGDTAWEITWKSRPDELQRYLDDRQAKGFNVVQVVAMSHQRLEEFGVQNRTGEPFFLNQDFSTLNPRYFDYLDTIITSANAQGLAVALVPLWAGMNTLYFDARYQRFYLSVDESLLLAQYIGARYAGHNVIWIVGGDNKYDTPVRKAFWESFAIHLRESSGMMHLTTVHPHGWGSSFDYFDNTTSWIDFHMYQSSHLAGGAYTHIAAQKGYGLHPVRPVLNGEAAYEDIYHNLWAPGDTRLLESFRIRPEHVRQASYESILSGALVGITYGANGVWQWSTAEIPGSHSPRVTVDQAWQFPGSTEMGVLKSLMVRYGWYRLTPAPELVLSTTPEDRYIPVALSEEYLMAYFPPHTSSAVIKAGLFAGDGHYVWIDPSTGLASQPQPLSYGQGPLVFTPPDTLDWLLVITPGATSFPLDTSIQPVSVALRQNTPNPFNPETQIAYEIPEPSRVGLVIYSVQGKRVRTLVDEFQQAGIYTGRWNGLNDAGTPVASGIYLYRLQTNRGVETKKMLLIK